MAKYKDLKKYTANHKYNPDLIAVAYNEDMLDMEIMFPCFFYRFKFNERLMTWEGVDDCANRIYVDHVAIYRGNAKHLKQFKEHLFFDKEEL